MAETSLLREHQGTESRVADLLSAGKEALQVLGREEAQASTERLLEELLGTQRASLYLNFDRPVSEDLVRIFQAQIQKRKARIPLAYVLGKAYFWEESLEVGPGCLIPRPETEILIEGVLDVFKDENHRNFYFMDLGAGSGAIAVSLLRFFKKAEAVLADLSKEALFFARRNLERYHLLDRSELICSDWFKTFEPCGGNAKRSLKWDFIVTNPPYLSEEDFKQLEPEVGFEPRMALNGGSDGLDFYRRTVREAPFYLKEGGWLFMEAGKFQASQIVQWLDASGRYEQIQLLRDLAGVERVVRARLRRHG